MSVSIAEFWKLAVESGFLTPDQCEQQRVEFSNFKGATFQGNARSLAAWLVSQNVLSPDQAKLLLTGRRASKPTSMSSRFSRRGRPRKELKQAAIAIMGTAAVALVVYAIVSTRGDTNEAHVAGGPHRASDRNGAVDTSQPTAPGARQSDGSSGSAESSTSADLRQTRNGLPASPYEIVEDDGALLWASPTDGKAIELEHVPPGAQLLLVARPSEILAHPEGVKALRGLGPRFDRLRRSWEADAGVKLEEIRQLIVAVIPRNDKTPSVTLVVRLEQPRDLVALWGRSSLHTLNSQTYYQAGDWYFYTPDGGAQRLFVMGPLAEIQDVIEARGAPPIMRRELAAILRTSDADRHFTMLLAPNFIFADGRKLLTGPLSKILEPLDWLWRDRIQAGLLSVHFGSAFYGEARFCSAVDTLPVQLASRMRERVERLPIQIEQYIGRVQLDHWQPLAIKFPGMVRYLHSQTRVGVESGQTVVNFILPGSAAHNLVLAAELAIFSTAIQDVAGGSTVVTAPPATIHDVLRHKMSLVFPQLSLEFALRDLAAEVRDSIPQLPFPFDVKILGADLQEEGITRNQQVKDFNLRDRTVAELLTAVVMKANPVTTVTDPSQENQKLIWVVAADPDDDRHELVLITTRRAAAQKGYALPRPFREE